MMLFLGYLLIVATWLIFWGLLIADQKRLKERIFCPICDLPLTDSKCLACYPPRNISELGVTKQEVNEQLRNVTKAVSKNPRRLRDHLKRKELCSGCPENECVAIPDHCGISRHFSD